MVNISIPLILDTYGHYAFGFDFGQVSELIDKYETLVCATE